MTYGLKRLTNAANRMEAWKDWQKLVNYAYSVDCGPLATRYAPPPGSGWRKVDKCIAALRTAISAALAERNVTLLSGVASGAGWPPAMDQDGASAGENG